MRKLLPLLTLLFAVLFTGGCITDPVTGDSVIGAPISESEEAQMGLAYKPQIIQEFDGAYPDPQLQSHLGEIVLGMAKHSVRPDLPWTFTVLNTSVPNAFAVPGGQVFVTRGILAQMEDEAEFAVVMGHELGHVEHRHSVRQQGWQMIGQGAVAVIGGAYGDEWASVSGQFAQLGMLKFSRDDETEADARGVENAYTAGYDPREGADVFRMFLKMKQDAGGGPPTWLSSHPADEERIQHILELSAERDPRLAGNGAVPGLKVTTSSWSSLMAKLKVEQKTYDRYDAAMAKVTAAKGDANAIKAAIPALRQCEQELPGHALFPAALGKALLFAGDQRGARKELERATAMNQGLAEPEYVLGEICLDEKDWNGAAAHANRGLQLLPDNYPCVYVRGEAFWNLGQRAAAERDLQAVLQGAPADSRQYKAAAARLGTGAAAPAAAPKNGAKRAR